MTLKANEDFIVISEDHGTFTATLGNVKTIMDDRHIEPFEKVLLRNIKDSTGYQLMKKDWFQKSQLIRLAKKHFEQRVSFEADCKQIILKGKKSPELYCEFTHISNIQLLEK